MEMDISAELLGLLSRRKQGRRPSPIAVELIPLRIIIQLQIIHKPVLLLSRAGGLPPEVALLGGADAELLFFFGGEVEDGGREGELLVDGGFREAEVGDVEEADG